MECGTFSPGQSYNNIHFFWILIDHIHSLILEEWICAQSFQQLNLKTELILTDKSSKDVSCVDYRKDLLALGFNNGEIHIYEAAKVPHERLN